jgi:predicted nucleic acid-binding Zn ribbon protein
MTDHDAKAGAPEAPGNYKAQALAAAPEAAGLALKARAKAIEEANKNCPVCGGIRLPHQQYCSECEEQRQTMEKIRRRRARDRAFGNPWDFGQ